MTKNFRNSGYERKERDFYPTPDCYVDWLFDHWKPDCVSIWEPCIGEGHMATQIRKHGYYCTGYDIDHGHDYLEDSTIRKCSITNPPYGRLGPKIVEHAIKNNEMCAFLLPFDFDAGGSRSWMFSKDGPFLMKVVCNKRVKWIPDSTSSGMHNYAWYVWDWNYCGKESVTRFSPKKDEWPLDIKRPNI